MNLDEMSDFLKIPSSTYNTYESGKSTPKTNLFDLYEEKTGIDLWKSYKIGIISFNDSGEKMKSIQDERSTIEVDVYYDHTIEDIVYKKKSLIPAFKITCPGARPHSFCVRIGNEFFICRQINKTRMSRRNEYLLVMEKDGQIKTGPFYTTKTAITEVFKAFIISHKLTEEKLMERMLSENGA
jgi:hypothetical protein